MAKIWKLTTHARLKPATSKTAAIAAAVDGSNFWEANGRFDFWGWILSDSKSSKSLKIYVALARKQNAKKVLRFLKQRLVSKSWPEKTRGTKIKVFLNHCFILKRLIRL